MVRCKTLMGRWRYGRSTGMENPAWGRDLIGDGFVYLLLEPPCLHIQMHAMNTLNHWSHRIFILTSSIYLVKTDARICTRGPRKKNNFKKCGCSSRSQLEGHWRRGDSGSCWILGSSWSLLEGRWHRGGPRDHSLVIASSSSNPQTAPWMPWNLKTHIILKILDYETNQLQQKHFNEIWGELSKSTSFYLQPYPFPHLPRFPV